MTSVEPEPVTSDKPYRGPDSYRSEDAHLFFGRDPAADQVIAKVLSSRFTVLHAQSGAGKTSLLNARVIPELEARGWVAVRAVPQKDPIREVRLATFLQLLPSPRAEAAAIDRAIRALAQPDENPTIRDLVDRYDDLALRDERRRRLIAPIPLGLEDAKALNTSHAETLPFFCRLLRTSIDAAGFDAHLAALSANTFLPASDLRASDLVTALSNVALLRPHDALVADLYAAPPGLLPFFKTWLQLWGVRHPRYSIVLVLDQFEQMFTLFTDRRRSRRPATEETPDWSVRDAFFQELRDLYECREEVAASVEADRALPTPLPIRYSISMRDEFVARLDPVRCFVPDLDLHAYHLPLLSPRDAKTAIEQPARKYGYAYDEKCLNDILRKLLKEGRFIEPAHLQVVCEKLWEVRGRELAKASPSSESDAEKLPEIDFDRYEKLGFAEGILRNFVSGILARLGPEALELLEPLITSSGTRNIVEWSQLINRALRDPAQRERLVLELQNRSIVRVEWRLGGRFVEITHEFLIEPILHAIRSNLYGDGETARFIGARRVLERIAMSPNRSDERLLLSPREFDILEAKEDQLVWSRATSETMLRSAVVNAWESEAGAGERIRKWADRYRGYTTDSGSYDTASGRYRTGQDGGSASILPPDPGMIISEYLTSRSSKVRESAIYALGLFGEDSGIERLVALALSTDEDARAAREARRVDPASNGGGSPETSKGRHLVDLALSGGHDAEAAADALLRLEGEPQRYAILRLISEVDVPDHRFLAYTLLGKMHSKGAEVVLPPRNMRSRLQTARIRVSPTLESGKWRRRWRLLEPGIIGGGIGVVLVAVLLEIAFSQSRISGAKDAMLYLTFGLLIGAPLLIIAAAERYDPIHLHVDQRAAAFIEVGRAGLAPLFKWPVALLLAFGLIVSFMPLEATAPFKLLIPTILLIAITTAAVRAGTLFAYEAFTDHVDANRFWQAVTGGTMGLVVIVLWIMWITSFVSDPAARAASVKVGLFLLPACFALSFAYARSEEAAPPRRPLLGPASRVIVGVPLTIILGLLAFAIGRSALNDTNARTLAGMASLSPATSLTWPIDFLPTRVRFAVPRRATDSGVPGVARTDSAVTVMGLVSGIDPSSDSLGIQLFDSTGSPPSLDFSANPPEFDLQLRGGTYTVEVNRPDTMEFALELLRRARRAFGLRSEGAREALPKYTLAIGLITPAILKARDSVRKASMLAERVYTLTHSLPADWERAGFAIDSSIRLMRFALATDSLFTIAPTDLNRVCWWGAVAGRAGDVLSICELGVARAPSDLMVRDSRGVARALVGDRQGAIADLTAFRDAMRQSPDTLQQRWVRVRNGWIEKLQRGEDLELWRVRADTRE